MSKGFTPLEILRDNYFKQMKKNKFLTGFTLIETLIALAVVSVGMVIVLQVFPSGFSIEKNTQLETQATLAAQEKVEELLSESFSELSVGTTTESSLPIPLERFSRTTKVSFINANLQESASDTSFKKIEVTVFWESPIRIGTKTVKLITLFSEK